MKFIIKSSACGFSEMQPKIRKATPVEELRAKKTPQLLAISKQLISQRVKEKMHG